MTSRGVVQYILFRLLKGNTLDISSSDAISTTNPKDGVLNIISDF